MISEAGCTHHTCAHSPLRSGEEDPLTKTRLSAKNPAVKCDSRLPAIDQSSVKQKHKSTITPQKPEKAGHSKPSPGDSSELPLFCVEYSPFCSIFALSPVLQHAAQAPQIFSRKRRPNLGRLTVSPETQSPRASGDRSRQQKLQLLAKAPALRGADPAAPQEGPIWASDAKLKMPTGERRNVVLSSQLMTVTGHPPERASKGEPSALSQKEPRQALSQASRGASGPQVVRGSLGTPFIASTVGRPRGVPLRFRDKDFYSVLPLNSGEENDDTEEETQVEEELLLAGMRPPRSPASDRRSKFLGTLATQVKNKIFEGNPENCRATPSGRSEFNHGSLRKSSAAGPVTGGPSVRQRVFQDPGLPDRGPPKENDSDNEKKTFNSWDTKFKPRLDDDLTAENVFSDCASSEDRPGTHGCERDGQTYLNPPRGSPDCFLSGRPTAPRSSMNSSSNTPGSSMHRVLRDDIPGHLLLSTLVHGPDSEGTSMYNVRQPLLLIRHRNPFASAGNHSYFPVNSAHEFDVRGAENTTLTSPSQGAPLHTEDLLLSPQSRLPSVGSSSSSPSRRNLQGHLQVPGSLQENTPFTFFAVSDFQNDNVTRMAVSGFTGEKEGTKIKADPEKLKKLQESLLEEVAEEEGDLCRICHIAGGSPTNPLLEPCSCTGSLQFVHHECLRKWLEVKITSGADLRTAKTCEMCKGDLLVDLDDFNMTAFYQRHQHSRAQNELVNSGLYLVLLLQLYEQRFAELMRLNYNRVARETVSLALTWTVLQPSPKSGSVVY
ncbi:hypothetical protein MC885_021056 [Smutsia gigantea]|nr:hypothetical protein MC885_021056 [Smutsia gigantea]